MAPKKRERTCPDCATVFGAVADLGQCPKCRKILSASAPPSAHGPKGRDLNVHGADPDWTTAAPIVERLRLVNRPLPRLPFPRLRHLTLYGRAIDNVEIVPDHLRSLSLDGTSVLDLSPLHRVTRLGLGGSRYCVTHGFGPRTRVSPGFEKVCRGLVALDLGETWATDAALAIAVMASPNLEWLDIGRNHKRPFERVDLSGLGRLEYVGLSDLHARSVSLPESVRVVNLFRARIEPPDLSCASRLEELSLSYTTFGDDVLKTLPPGVPLRRAQLDRAGVTAVGLAALAKVAPDLEELNLSETDLEDDDVEHLLAFPKLRELSLRDTRVTEDALSALEELPIDRLETNERDPPGSTWKSRRIISYVSVTEAFFGEES